jgi:hypothetical protein
MKVIPETRRAHESILCMITSLKNHVLVSKSTYFNIIVSVFDLISQLFDVAIVLLEENCENNLDFSQQSCHN